MDDDDRDDGGAFGADVASSLGRGGVRCETCGSGNVVATDGGDVICLDCGTQSQDVRHLVQEDWDGPAVAPGGGATGAGGGRIRRRARADPRGQRVHAEDAFTTFDLLAAVQAVLGAQVGALVRVCGAPPALPGVVWALWARYLSRWAHAGAPPVAVIDGTVAPGTTTRYLATLAAAGARPPPTVPLSLELTLALCYLGARWLALPVLPADIAAWARCGALPYLNAFMTVLRPPARHGLAAARTFLSPDAVPTPAHLDRLALALAHSVGVPPASLPPPNVGGALARLVNRLRLPPTALALALQLLALDDADKTHAAAYAARLEKRWARRTPRKGRAAAAAAAAGVDDGTADDARAGTASKRRRMGGAPATAGSDDNDGDADGRTNAAADGDDSDGDQDADGGAPTSPHRLVLDALTALRKTSRTGLAPGCADVGGVATAAYVAALLAVSFRCAAGWEAWVDATLAPGCVGDAGHVAARIGLATGPWAALSDLLHPTATAATSGGSGTDSDASSTTAGADASNVPSTAASVAADRHRRLMSAAHHPDVPLPDTHDAVAAMPRALLPRHLAVTGSTVLTGGDVGLGRGELGYVYAELEGSGAGSGAAADGSSDGGDSEEDGADGAGAGAAAVGGGVAGAGSGATVVIRVGEATAGAALRALSQAHVAAARGGLDDGDDDPFAAALGLSGASSGARPEVAAYAGLPSRRQQLLPLPPAVPPPAGAGGKGAGGGGRRLPSSLPSTGSQSLHSQYSLPSQRLGDGGSGKRSSLSAAAVGALPSLSQSSSQGQYDGDDDVGGDTDDTAPAAATAMPPPSIARADADAGEPAGGAGTEVAVTLGPRHEQYHARAAGRLWRSTATLRRVDDAAKGLKAWAAEQSQAQAQAREQQEEGDGAATRRQGDSDGKDDDSSSDGGAVQQRRQQSGAGRRAAAAGKAGSRRRQAASGDDDDDNEEDDDDDDSKSDDSSTSGGGAGAGASSSSAAAGAAAPAAAPAHLLPPPLASELLMFPRLRQPDGGRSGLVGPRAPRPLGDLPLRYRALLGALGSAVDVDVAEVLRHADVLELLLALYTPLPPDAAAAAAAGARPWRAPGRRRQRKRVPGAVAAAGGVAAAPESSS